MNPLPCTVRRTLKAGMSTSSTPSEFVIDESRTTRRGASWNMRWLRVTYGREPAQCIPANVDRTLMCSEGGVRKDASYPNNGTAPWPYAKLSCFRCTMREPQCSCGLATRLQCDGCQKKGRYLRVSNGRSSASDHCQTHACNILLFPFPEQYSSRCPPCPCAASSRPATDPVSCPPSARIRDHRESVSSLIQRCG